MLRSSRLIPLAFLLLVGSLFAGDSEIWKEYGLVQTETARHGQQLVTTHRLKDLTGAVAAWEWRRSPAAQPCDLADFCSYDGNRTSISEANYVVTFDGPLPTKAQVDEILQSLPEKHSTSLPAILAFLPKEGRVANSARYILGPSSLRAFAPELASTNPGFAEGAEAQIAQYRLKGGSPARLALFYYPTPEMARLHMAALKGAVGPRVKRSSVLVVAVLGAASDDQADTLLSRVQYEAKITWNEVPPPSPIKPLYRLLVDILYISGLLSVLCLTAGLLYAASRLYRRRYGNLESDEAMTVLNLTGVDR